ncbi:MAG TPA: hypothetical protein VG367_19090 [Mucilaginibacter sp.]|jgi:hypothetical protein|nr:hypothetical protein [Mucilaginibacter sp.]
MKKHLHINLRVLLLIAVYLFFHFTNAFFVNRRVSADKQHAIVRQGTICMIHLQKPAKTTVSETRLSFAQLIQKASKFFILLLFFAISIKAACLLFFEKRFIPADPPYLCFCVIRI